jgi:hypothetical protein
MYCRENLEECQQPRIWRIVLLIILSSFVTMDSEDFMRNRLSLLLIALCFVCVPVFSQAHTSVPLDGEIYRLLENAQARGLCGPLPSAKPYSRVVVIRAIDEILASENFSALGDGERAILEDMKKKYSQPDTGFDLIRFYHEKHAGAHDTKYLIDGTASRQSAFSDSTRIIGTIGFCIYPR